MRISFLWNLLLLLKKLLLRASGLPESSSLGSAAATYVKVRRRWRERLKKRRRQRGRGAEDISEPTAEGGTCSSCSCEGAIVFLFFLLVLCDLEVDRRRLPALSLLPLHLSSHVIYND